MPRSVDFYYDYGSPASYLAYRRLPQLCAAHDAELVYRPVLLGAIFKATGNDTPAVIPAKARYMQRDLARCAARHDIPMRFNPHFLINTLTAMRGAFAADEIGVLEGYNQALFTATWVDEKDTGDAAVLCAVIDEANLPGQQILDRAGSDAIKARLREATDAAVDRGLFGCPTLFVGDEMFFGQDRLEFVAEALDG